MTFRTLTLCVDYYGQARRAPRLAFGSLPRSGALSFLVPCRICHFVSGA